MWKYVSRRLKDTFERSVNYFDVRSATGIANTSNVNSAEQPSLYPCQRRHQGCWSTFDRDKNTNDRKWYNDCINGSWLGAITWSSAVLLSWYASQFLHLKKKYTTDNSQCIWKQKPNWKLFFKPTKTIKKSEFLTEGNISEEYFKSAKCTNPGAKCPQSLFFITNDQAERKQVDSVSSTESDDLSVVLNSIENKLGVAAIGSGQIEDGLNLLKSAANRHHAPALFNLALCYELGLGMKVNEKMALELYKVAATLEHPQALYNLAVYYGQGRGGLDKDLNTAMRLLKLAAIKGQEDAIRALKAPETNKNTNSYSSELQVPEKQWSYNCTDEPVVLTQATLFADQINGLLFSNELGCDARAY